MKNSISWVLQSIIITLFTILVINIVNMASTINKANAFHQSAIAEIQASNFSSTVIQKYENSTTPYIVNVTNHTVDNNSLSGTERIYEVETTYSLSIPIIGYSSTKTLTGYAR